MSKSQMAGRTESGVMKTREKGECMLKGIFGYLAAMVFGLFGEESAPDGQGTEAPASAGQAATPPEGSNVTEGQEESHEGGQIQPEGQEQSVAEEAINDNRDQELENYKGKLTAMERKVAAINSTLRQQGFQLVQDSEGNYIQIPLEQNKKKREASFKDQHKNDLAAYFRLEGMDDADALKSSEKFLSNLSPYLEDMFHTFSENREEVSRKEKLAQDNFNKTREEAVGIALQAYPELDTSSPRHDKRFLQESIRILNDKYPNDPYGHVKAANEAAANLNIRQRNESKVKVDAFKAGVNNKKVLSAVQGRKEKSGSNAFKVLSAADYLKLPAKEKKVYEAREREYRINGR